MEIILMKRCLSLLFCVGKRDTCAEITVSFSATVSVKTGSRCEGQSVRGKKEGETEQPVG